MYWLVSVLVFETVLEGLLCSGVYTEQPQRRKVLAVFLASTLVLCLAVWCFEAWQVWLWVVPFGLYRLLNILRVYQARLPRQQLRTVALRAFSWLVAGQIIVLVLAWAVSYYHLQMLLLDILVAAQLLCAIILLRASTHTWRHAQAPLQAAGMTDRELPSVSVLVPARNETDDLQVCLAALVASDYPKLEIVVLDDCSVNRRTPEIIRSFAHDGVRFIAGKVPDESRWLAKNYAYEQLAQAASGDVLLFCGVDALLEPQSIRQLVGLLEAREKNMLSVMPLRTAGANPQNALLQSMRYYWELCLPRSFFKRPPVLSTCWLIRLTSLKQMGGFASVSRSVTPEAPLAKRAVITDSYSFIRSDERLGVYSNKPAGEQYGTTLRVRYPQLHRRLELVALVSVFELLFLLGPLLGFLLIGHLNHTLAYVAVWGVSLLCLVTTYGIVAVGARLIDPWYGWLLMPVAFVVDLAMLHVSLWKYEFSSINWKGRNVCIPVMQVSPNPYKQRSRS